MSNRLNHPCFSGECSPTTGRIHLPVSPICNISCLFCGRGISQIADRPGTASRVLSPAEALALLDKALRLCPELRVAGVAGPGDPLASSHALDTLVMVKGKYPGLINCLSTNGLSLYDSLPRIAEAGIGTLTVTVNSVDPAVQSFLCAGVAVNGEFYRGSKGAEILIAAQEKGIKGARALGITIKVNMVLVPAINGHRVMEVAKAVSEWGASIINVIPIIPAGPFSNMPAPTAAETEEANQAAGQYLEVMRHCRRCRADACGIPGVSEFSRELYGNSSPVDTFSHG